MDEQYLGPKTLERLMQDKDFTEDEGNTLVPAVQVGKGAFEALMARIEWVTEGAEDWWVGKDGSLIICTRTTTNTNQSFNGGDYTYEVWFTPTGLGVDETEWNSSDWCPGTGELVDTYECVVSTEGLRRMAQLATITIAAKALVAKQPGSFGKLKKAVRAL